MNQPTTRLNTRFKMARILPIAVMIDPPSGAAASPRPKPRAESFLATRPELCEAPHVPLRHAGQEYAEELYGCQVQFTVAWPRTRPGASSPYLPIRVAFLQGFALLPYCCIAVAASILARRATVFPPPVAAPNRNGDRGPCRRPVAPSAPFPPQSVS